MKKQTAVEWLKDWMGKNQYFIGNDLLEAMEQAKEMEKEQIIQANRDGVDMVVGEKPFVTGDEYYNETYGGDK